jgi:hypothetical protein
VHDRTALCVAGLERAMFASAAAVFAGSPIGALIVKTTLCPSGTTLANAALSSLTSGKATLSNRERSFAALSRATISRSIVLASIVGDFAAVDMGPSNQTGLKFMSRAHGSQPHPALQAGFRSYKARA